MSKKTEVNKKLKPVSEIKIGDDYKFYYGQEVQAKQNGRTYTCLVSKEYNNTFLAEVVELDNYLVIVRMSDMVIVSDILGLTLNNTVVNKSKYEREAKQSKEASNRYVRNKQKIKQAEQEIEDKRSKINFESIGLKLLSSKHTRETLAKLQYYCDYPVANKDGHAMMDKMYANRPDCFKRFPAPTPKTLRLLENNIYSHVTDEEKGLMCGTTASKYVELRDKNKGNGLHTIKDKTFLRLMVALYEYHGKLNVSIFADEFNITNLKQAKMILKKKGIEIDHWKKPVDIEDIVNTIIDTKLDRKNPKGWNIKALNEQGLEDVLGINSNTYTLYKFVYPKLELEVLKRLAACKVGRQKV